MIKKVLQTEHRVLTAPLGLRYDRGARKVSRGLTPALANPVRERGEKITGPKTARSVSAPRGAGVVSVGATRNTAGFFMSVAQKNPTEVYHDTQPLVSATVYPRCTHLHREHLMDNSLSRGCLHTGRQVPAIRGWAGRTLSDTRFLSVYPGKVCKYTSERRARL